MILITIVGFDFGFLYDLMHNPCAYSFYVNIIWVCSVLFFLV